MDKTPFFFFKNPVHILVQLSLKIFLMCQTLLANQPELNSQKFAVNLVNWAIRRVENIAAVTFLWYYLDNSTPWLVELFFEPVTLQWATKQFWPYSYRLWLVHFKSAYIGQEIRRYICLRWRPISRLFWIFYDLVEITAGIQKYDLTNLTAIYSLKSKWLVKN